MGGLGNEPEPDNENDPLLRLKHSLEESKTKVNKIQFFKNKEPDNKEEYALNFNPENNSIYLSINIYFLKCFLREEAKARMISMLEQVRKSFLNWLIFKFVTKF